MSSKQLAEFSVEQADADSIIRRLIKRLSNTIPDLTLPTLNLGAGVDVMDADKASPVEILPADIAPTAEIFASVGDEDDNGVDVM